MSTIPASEIVNVTPAVLPAGGRQLDLIGLLLTTSTRVPVGAVQPFATPQDVSDYFGGGSAEATAAANYFLGFTNSNGKPGSILFAQYPVAPVAAYLRGGALGLTLSELQAITPGTLTIVVDGVSKTSSSIDLSAASSFSNAATIIQTAFTTPGFTVTYDSTSGAFKVTSTTTGASSTAAFATGALSDDFKLTAATGAVLSQGAIASVPATFMDGVVDVTQNWAGFATIFNPDSTGQNSVKEAFALWNGDQNNRYAFVCWDVDLAPATANPASSSLGRLLAAAEVSGTFLIAGDGTTAVDATYAAFVLGVMASLDFTQTNGRTTFAFRRQSGLAATASTATAAANLRANGYNYVGAIASANDEFVWLYPGLISGDFLWADSYVNQIWLNNALQLSLMTLLQTANSIPYNVDGYALIEASCQEAIDAAINFGAIRAGVTLSDAQVAEVNQAAGVVISDTLQNVGYYLQVLDADPSTRVARGSPPITFWYMDGQSVQQIDLTSINVQ